MKGSMKKAFTLSEVLITLGIIGIVAALTMPALVAKYQEKETAVKLKKFYSVMSQAFELAQAEHGDPTNWDLIASDSQEGAVNMINNFSEHLKVLKNCGTGTGCWYNGNQHTLKGAVDANIDTTLPYAKMQMGDGTAIAVTIRGPNGPCTSNRGTSEALQSTCAILNVDINGPKPPNVYGKDVFRFNVTKYGIIPGGVQEDTMYNFETNCRTDNDGFGCAAWVISHENLDYLHCDDLSWNGKTKCD